MTGFLRYCAAHGGYFWDTASDPEGVYEPCTVCHPAIKPKED
jgi:hypothetical protein